MQLLKFSHKKLFLYLTINFESSAKFELYFVLLNLFIFLPFYALAFHLSVLKK